MFVIVHKHVSITVKSCSILALDQCQRCVKKQQVKHPCVFLQCDIQQAAVHLSAKGASNERFTDSLKKYIFNTHYFVMLHRFFFFWLYRLTFLHLVIFGVWGSKQTGFSCCVKSMTQSCPLCNIWCMITACVAR